MKNIVFIVITLSIFQSCNLLERNLCGSHVSDDACFRANTQAISTNMQFAQEKALFLAKKEIAVDIDNYILDNYSHQSFLADPNYENKITIARKTILSDINLVCSKTIPKKGIYKSYVAIEITKMSVDNEVKRQLTNQVE